MTPPASRLARHRTSPFTRSLDNPASSTPSATTLLPSLAGSPLDVSFCPAAWSARPACRRQVSPGVSPSLVTEVPRSIDCHQILPGLGQSSPCVATAELSFYQPLRSRAFFELYPCAACSISAILPELCSRHRQCVGHRRGGNGG